MWILTQSRVRVHYEGNAALHNNASAMLSYALKQKSNGCGKNTQHNRCETTVQDRKTCCSDNYTDGYASESSHSTVRFSIMIQNQPNVPICEKTQQNEIWSKNQDFQGNLDLQKAPFCDIVPNTKKKNQRLIGVGVLALHEMSKTQAFLGRPVLASKWGSRFVMKRSPGLGLEPKPTVFINKNNTSDGLNYFAHTVFENMIST
jgi:hypothetical protein